MAVNYNSKSENIPLVNGILYADGSIDHICIRRDYRRRRFLEKCLNTQGEIFETPPLITEECQCKDLDLMVSVGAGNLGGDGFVLAETICSNDFLWLIAFENSNPFVSIKRAGEKLFIENNIYEVWEIDIKEIMRPKIAIIMQSKFLR